MPYTRTTWVDYPATTTPITAARLNNIETGILAIEAGSGAITNGIYVNEAARDAAITSPTEGMRVYLTAPTVPAATGTTTAVPTGVQTIYNGAAWVTVTEVGAYTTTSGTISPTGAYVTTLTGDATALSVTLQTGTSALVTMSCTAQHTGVGQTIAISFSVSGATTLAASTSNGTAHTYATASGSSPLMRTIPFTGLTAGTNTFTLNYLCGAPTATMTARALTVKGIA